MASTFHITYIGTATALIELPGLTILTDPYFSPQGTVWTGASGAKLCSNYQPSKLISELPPLDLVLLSHEDHKDNLDDLGRQLLNGRHVLTTIDGSNKLAPRPGVRGMRPWESKTIQFGNGPAYTITATPCEHLPGGQCIGFVITTESFGHAHGKPNALYFSGDTVYLSELSRLEDDFHITTALFCLGSATVPRPGGQDSIQITMDGAQAVRLAKTVGADTVLPLHFEGWNHFKEDKQNLQNAFDTAVDSKTHFRFLKPGAREVFDGSN